MFRYHIKEEKTWSPSKSLRECLCLAPSPKVNDMHFITPLGKMKSGFHTFSGAKRFQDVEIDFQVSWACWGIGSGSVQPESRAVRCFTGSTPLVLASWACKSQGPRLTTGVPFTFHLITYFFVNACSFCPHLWLLTRKREGESLFCFYWSWACLVVWRFRSHLFFADVGWR